MSDAAGAIGDGSAVLKHSEPVPDRVPRADLDYYPTPAWCVEAIRPFLPASTTILDPACGEGELLHPFTKVSVLRGIELDDGRAARARRVVPYVTVGDALEVEWPDADLAICNPPFSHALAFVERAVAWRAAHPRSTVAFLLRLTFLEAQERRRFHQTNPSDVYVLADRPKFRPGKNGKMATDSVTCAWFVWGPGRGGRWSVL